MIFLAIIGIVIRYTLIPGSERWEKYGENVELRIMGMDRHQWGLVHLAIGLLLVGLLVLHLVLHWKQIVCMVKMLIPNTAFRMVSVTIVLTLSTFIALSPLYVVPEIGEPIYGRRGQKEGQNKYNHIPVPIVEVDTPKPQQQKSETLPETESIPVVKDTQRKIIDNQEKHREFEHVLEIRGYNTFSELANNYNISAEELKKTLGIPASVSNNERLGRVRRTYNFSMSNVEEAILNLQGK